MGGKLFRGSVIGGQCSRCGQHAGDVNHKPDDRLALLYARPAVTVPAAGITALILLGDRGTQA